MENKQLTPHFSFFELTVTLNAALQAKNREIADGDEDKPLALAQFGEEARGHCAGALRVHSGYRCKDLNGATKGSSDTSQHPRWEALDCDEPGVPVEETFRKLLEAARAGKFRFGQLILEEADRGYKGADGQEVIAKWVHVSMAGTLDPAKIGQVMTMKEGADGKLHYTLIEQLKFNQGESV